MCGIFGAVFLDHRIPHLDSALAALNHRGPDFAGRWTSKTAVFGHARLSIVDLSPLGNQPMVSQDGTVVVLLNGEIYNHNALRSELVALGHSFRSRSDTEVVVEGYRAWGPKVIERLDGMFAISIWNSQTETLVLARDRVGKKPLFFAQATPLAPLLFASETEALFAAGLPCEMNPSALPALFTWGAVRAPQTNYRGVAQLPPATVLTVQRGRPAETRRYWAPPFNAPRLQISKGEAIREVRRLIDAAVATRLEADVPIGALLSGGIDSTIISGAMAKEIGSRVHTFSAGFSGDARFDETAYAQLASSRFRTEHHVLTVGPEAFDALPALVDLHDGPFADASAVPMAALCTKVREHVTVALTGDGGDEVFCGYPRLVYAELMARTPRLFWNAASHFANVAEGVVGARRARLIRKGALPFPELLLSWCSVFGLDLLNVLRPDFLASVDENAPRREAAEVVGAFPGATTLASVLAFNFQTYLPDDLLLKADRASMMNAVELRSPLLDTSVVEFCARLPDSMLRRGQTMKWILKEAYSDLLPPEIVNRPKMGFGVPLMTWFRGALRDRLVDSFSTDSPIWEFVNRSFVEDALSTSHNRGADDGSRIFLLLTFDIWLRRMRERSATRAPAIFDLS